jgi:hypothetical protein
LEARGLVDDIDSLVEEKIPHGNVRVLMYFDEAHTLSDVLIRKDEGCRNFYDAFISAIDHMSPAALFAITLSTNSNLRRFSPPHDSHGSGRVVEGKDCLQVPYTELLFDCLENDQPIFTPGTMSLEEVSEIGFMVKFGRPL